MANTDGTLVHVDYPHEPGRLSDCAACEDGPCVCNPDTDAACVSRECVQAVTGSHPPVWPNYIDNPRA